MKRSSRLVSAWPFCWRSSVSVPSATRRPDGDHADAVGHAFGHLEDVRGHDDGAAGADALAAAAPLTWRAETASRPVSGSSRMMRRGSCTSAPASATFWRMPLEKPSQRSCAMRLEAERVEQVLARRGSETRRRRCPRGRRRIRDIRAASACRRSSARRTPTPSPAWRRRDLRAHRCRRSRPRRHRAAAGPQPCARWWSCRRRWGRAAHRIRRRGW